jgi:hypothetical protein
VVTDALRRFREVFAYVLLTVAALYLIGGLSLLVKDTVGLDFSGKAAAFGYLFGHPVVILSLVAAVALVVGFGEVTRHARVVVLIALAIAGISLLLALVTWLAGLGSNDAGSPIGDGVLGAGNIVGGLLGLAQLLLLGLTAWFAFSAFKALPRAAPQTSVWGQPGYGASPGYGQQAWGSPDPGYGQQPQGWTPSPSAQGWPAGQTGGTQAVESTGMGWGDPAAGFPDYQGQPASAWGAAAPGSAGPSAPGGWAAPGAAQQWAPAGAQQWQRPAEAPRPPEGGQPWRPPEPPLAREPQGSTAADVGNPGQWEPPADELESPAAEDEEPRRRSGWWPGPNP